MNSNKEEEKIDIAEVGLPRANSNGVFIFALMIITAFGVMAYSCTENKNRGHGYESPPQPLSGNEWFVGKASGIKVPKPPPPPLPTETPIKEVVKAKKVTPKRRLGGKVFRNSNSLNSKEKEKREEEVDRYQEDTITSFEPGTGDLQRMVRGRRPEYYLKRDVEAPISNFEVKAGTIIPAQLDMAINTDLGGPAVAHITRTVYDTVTGHFELIPPGTKLYGRIDPNVNFGQTRVDVIWDRLIFPNGASLVLENMQASDRAGRTGLHHTVDNHFDRLFGGAIMLSAISSGVQLSQPQRSADFGRAASAGQTLAAALGQNLGQVSTELIRRQMDVRPTISIPNGEHFTITVNKDMVLPGPWGTWD